MNTHRLVLAAAIACSLTTTDIRADIFSTCGVDLGASGRTRDWAVFTLGLDTKTGKAKKDAKDEFSGSSQAIGNVGAAGGGNVSMSGDSMIQGDLYHHQPGKFETSGRAGITGSRFNDGAAGSLLDQGAMDAMNASDFAAGLATSSQFQQMSEISLNDSQKITLSGNGCTVLNLTKLKLTGSSVLTLTGTAGTAFVINVTDQFSLSGSSQIVLAGGLTAADLLINVRGAAASVELSGSSQMTGIILAAKRDVHLSGSSMVFGEVIANTVQLSGSSKVTHAVSPARNP